MNYLKLIFFLFCYHELLQHYLKKSHPKCFQWRDHLLGNMHYVNGRLVINSLRHWKIKKWSLLWMLMFMFKLFWNWIPYSVKLLIKCEDKINITHAWIQRAYHPCVIHKTTDKFRHYIKLSKNNIISNTIMIQEAFCWEWYL